MMAHDGEQGHPKEAGMPQTETKDKHRRSARQLSGITAGRDGEGFAGADVASGQRRKVCLAYGGG